MWIVWTLWSLLIVWTCGYCDGYRRCVKHCSYLDIVSAVNSVYIVVIVGMIHIVDIVNTVVITDIVNSMASVDIVGGYCGHCGYTGHCAYGNIVDIVKLCILRTW